MPRTDGRARRHSAQVAPLARQRHRQLQAIGSSFTGILQRQFNAYGVSRGNLTDLGHPTAFVVGDEGRCVKLGLGRDRQRQLRRHSHARNLCNHDNFGAIAEAKGDLALQVQRDIALGRQGHHGHGPLHRISSGNAGIEGLDIRERLRLQQRLDRQRLGHRVAGIAQGEGEIDDVGGLDGPAVQIEVSPRACTQIGLCADRDRGRFLDRRLQVAVGQHRRGKALGLNQALGGDLCCIDLRCLYLHLNVQDRGLPGADGAQLPLQQVALLRAATIG